MHHPILGLTHLDLKWLLPATSPVVKVAAAFVIASGLSLMTYEGFVRRSSLGRMLGFDWQPASAEVSGDVIALPPSRSDHGADERPAQPAARKAA